MWRAKIQAWAKAGYFNDDFNGIGYDDSIRQFGQGNALFYVAGTWASNTFFDAMKNNVGVFFLPPRKGQPLVVTSSGNWPEYVSGKTDIPDLAAEWVELTSGELAGRLLAAKGTVPGFAMKKLPKAPNALFASIFKLASEMSRKDAVVTYMDAGSTGILDPMQSGLQDLMADRVTPTKFIDTLDPEATGRLVKNLADDLEGNGANLNKAIEGVAGLTSTFAEKDQELLSIIDHFDAFTATLRTRESQLGRVMDGFARTTSLLAEERRQIESLVSGLAQLSSTGLDLVSEHGARLDRDITVLTRVLRAVEANIDNVITLLDSAPILVAGEDLDGRDEGLLAAYDPEFQHLDLRTAISPVLGNLFAALGLPAICVPLPVPVDVTCAPGSPVPPIGSGAATAAPAAAQGVPTATQVPSTPIDSIVGLLGSSSTATATTSTMAPDGGGQRSTRSSGNVLARLSRLLLGGLG